MVEAVIEKNDYPGGAPCIGSRKSEENRSPGYRLIRHNGDSHRGDTDSHETLGTRDYMISRLLLTLYHQVEQSILFQASDT